MDLTLPIRATDACAARLAAIASAEGARKHLRVAVLGGGCSGFSYEFTLEDAVAQVTAAAFGDLKAAPQRLGLPDHPTPSSRTLAEAFYVRSPHIAEAALSLVCAADDVCQSVRDKLHAQRDDVPLDIPHPSFRGPF